MPVASQFHVPELADLARQVVRAPTTVRESQVEAAEALVLEIVDGDAYPIDYLVFRLTGYRGEMDDPPIAIGSAVRSDLSAFVAVVTQSMDLPSGEMLSVEDVARHLGVSGRTVSRLRRRGLVMRWVQEPDGRRRLGCMLETLEAFRGRAEKRLRPARAFSRMDDAQRRAIRTAAMEYRGTSRSINRVARDLARRTGRGRETIRSLLLADPAVVQAIGARVPLQRRDARVIERAIRMGMSWEALAEHHGRTQDALRRAVLRLRADRLRSWSIGFVELEMFGREDAEAVMLGAVEHSWAEAPVLSMEIPVGSDDLPGIDQKVETSLVAAMNLLRRRAAVAAAELPYAAGFDGIDRIETDLRWSFQLQQSLIRTALPDAFAVAAQHVGRPLLELPREAAAALAHQVISTTAGAVEELDPSRGQRLLGLVRLRVDRNLSQASLGWAGGRAAARRDGPLVIDRPFSGLVPWSRLIPSADLPAMATSPEVSDALTVRFGWRGPARTLKETSDIVGRSPQWLYRHLRRWNL